MTAGTGAPAIVLLAAGAGRRFGDVKQVQDIGGEPMCRRAARRLLAFGHPLVTVTGAHADAVAAALEGLSLEIAHNADWSQGLGSSIARGVRQVRASHAGVSGILVCLADQPLIEDGHYRRMLERHRQAPDRLLCTRHDAVTGPPVLFPADCLAELAHWKGRGAHALLEREAGRVEALEVPDYLDVDTPEDLALARARLA